MRRWICALLVATLLLTLAACGSSGSGNTSSGDQDGASDGAEAAATVSGVVNRLGDFLVLLTADGEYQTFDFDEAVDASALEEGDQVTVTYTGELGSEDSTPVAVAIEKAES